MNHISRIAGRGDRSDYHFGAINADANTRLYSIMRYKIGGADGEVVVDGHASGGEFAGINLTQPPEPIRTSTIESMTAQGLSAMNLTVALPPARLNAWGQPNTTFAQGDKVIANGSDQIKPLPNGSTAQVIGIVVESKAVGATSDLVQIELVAPGTVAGLTTESAYGIDAAADGKFLLRTWSNHSNSAVGLYTCPADGTVVKNFGIKLKVAAGAGKGATYTIMKSTNGGASFATTTLQVTVDEANTRAVNITDSVVFNQGEILAIRVNNKNGTDVGLAEGSNAWFQAQ